MAIDTKLVQFMTLNRHKSAAGNDCISGECSYLAIKYKFHVYVSAKKEYDYVLTVSAISPETKKILQSSRKKRELEKEGKLTKEDWEKIRKAQSLEKLNAEESVYLHKKDIKTDRQVRENTAKLVMSVYGNNQDDLLKALKMTGEIGGYNARTAFEMYQNDFFFRRGTVTKETLRANKNVLKGFCNYLAHKPITLLTDKDVENAVKAMPKSNRKKAVNLTEDFFAYCGEIGVYAGRNPVERYKDTAGKTPDRDTGNRLYPYSSNHLTKVAEKKLHDAIMDTLEDDISLAIPLVKGFRMSVNRLLELTWKDIVIEGNEVRIQDYKDNYTGGTHNYIRPPLRETADIIIMKHSILKEKYGITRLKKMKVVPILDEHAPDAKKKAELSKYFLKMLRGVGVTNEDLKRVKSPQKANEAGGAGYTFLCSHYDYVLQERCGVKLNSGIGCYLRGVRIYDTTSDYYRALSDATGNNVLQVIMNRDDLFVSDVVSTIELTSKTAESGRQIIAPPAPSGTRTALSTKKRILIPKGSTIQIIGPVEGVVRCREYPAVLAADETVTLF